MLRAAAAGVLGGISYLSCSTASSATPRLVPPRVRVKVCKLSGSSLIGYLIVEIKLSMGSKISQKGKLRRRRGRRIQRKEEEGRGKKKRFLFLSCEKL